jgi:hypothetical protein
MRKPPQQGVTRVDKGTQGSPAPESLVERINKYKLLMVAIGGVVVAVLTQLTSGIEAAKSLIDKFADSTSTAPAPTVPCVVANKPVIPPVKASEWESTRFRLSGQNSCVFRQGVYVTFQRNQAKDPRVRAPRFDREGCDRGEPVTKVECGWRREIPLPKGPWEIDVALPPLERLNNAPPKEIVELVIEIRDLENPNKLPEWSTVATVEQQNGL